MNPVLSRTFNCSVTGSESKLISFISTVKNKQQLLKKVLLDLRQIMT